jgi:phosphomevalonate kinase
VIRYIAQAVRLIAEIRQARANRQMQQEMKNVNLNEVQLNQSTNFHDANHADKQVREKITAARRNQLVEEV